MQTTDEQMRVLAEFPSVLQALVRAELAAGNVIVEIGGGFPAPPVGACLKFAKKVTTRPRESDEEISFYERNNSSYSGEFTDARRFHFVLEPPDDPPPYPDMDAIRAEIEARQRAADADMVRAAERDAFDAAQRVRLAKTQVADARSIPNPSSLVSRFLESMVMNYERWHDGIGYDLDLLRTASEAERDQIETMLLSQTLEDWRDIEALAAFNTPQARDKIRHAFETADLPRKIDFIAHATSHFSDEERMEVLDAALREIPESPTLTQVLLEVQDFHPQPVIDALHAGVRMKDGATAGSLAMMLLFIHGMADSPYDMSLRPFMLRFQTEDRETLYRELCERLDGASPV